MSIKAVDKVIEQHRAYQRERGTYPRTGIMHRRPEIRQPVLAGGQVAAMTWMDAVVAYPFIKKYLDPSESQKAEWFKDESIPLWQRWKFIDYRKTPGLVAASEDFDTVSPVRVAGGWLALVNNLGQNKPFPRSEEFWGYATRLAIERDSADPLPSWDSMAIDAIADAIKELPDTLQSAAGAALSAVDPGKLIPNPQPWADLFMSMAYLAGAGIVGYIVYKRMR